MASEFRVKKVGYASHEDRVALLDRLADLVESAIPEESDFALVVFLPDGRGYYIGSGDGRGLIPAVRKVLDAIDGSHS